MLKVLRFSRKNTDMRLIVLTWDQLSRAYQALGKTDEAVFICAKPKHQGQPL